MDSNDRIDEEIIRAGVEFAVEIQTDRPGMPSEMSSSKTIRSGPAA